MRECALGIQALNWRHWVSAAAALKHVHALECPGELLQEAPALLHDAEQAGLDWVHVHDIIPSVLAASFADKGSPGVSQWQALIRGVLQGCGAVRARYGSVDLQLDRLPRGKEFAAALARRGEFLRLVLATADEASMRLCVQVREPAGFPGAGEWEAAANLMHELDDSRIGLCINVVLYELPEPFDLDAFWRRCARHAAVVRFVYHPHYGEVVPRAQQEAWAAALQRHGFTGLVVVRPRVDEIDALPTVLSAVDTWAEGIQAM